MDLLANQQVVNMRPDLFNAAIMGVPFVDAVTTMSDGTIPLTIIEWYVCVCTWCNNNCTPHERIRWRLTVVRASVICGMPT